MKSAKYLTDKVHHQVDKAESPFISMQLLPRLLIVGVVVAYLLFIGIQQRFSPTPTPTIGWVFLALTVNLALLLVPIIFYKPSYGWFHPLVFFSIFVGLLEHLRQSSVYINGLWWHLALPGWSQESLTLLIAYSLALNSVGLVAYYFGFFYSPRLSVPQVTFSQPRHIALKTMLVVIFSVGVFAAYMQTRGGLVAHILSWAQGRNTVLAGQFYWNFFIQFGLVACLIWLAVDRKVHLKPMFWGCAGTLLIVKFFTAGSRSSIIYSLVLGVLVWQLRERKIAAGKLLVTALLSLIIISVLGSFRNSTYTNEIDWNSLTEFSSGFTSATGELDKRSGPGNGLFAILALVPEQVNFLYGSSYLALLTLPIPKALWAGKPGLIGGVVGTTFFSDTTGGVPPGPVGEAYWNFGILGILVLFFLFGVFNKWLADAFCKYATEPAAIVLYVITLYLFEPSGVGIPNWLDSLLPAIVLLQLFGAISFRRSAKKA